MHVALPRLRRADHVAPGEQRLGFLAAGHDPALGYVGGYFLTTARGRPLEFHYTTPVKPSPTHRILYGAELEPYVFGELIAANLIRQTTIEPAFLITDQSLVLAHRPGSSCPIICVARRAGGSPAMTVAATPPAPPLAEPTSELTTHTDFSQDIELLNGWLQETSTGLDLDEPLARVWEALREVLNAESKQAVA